MIKIFHSVLKTLAISIMIAVVFYSASSFAQPVNPVRWSIPDLATMVKNLSANMGQLMQFVTALAYVMGMYFIIEGILKLKKFGESRTMMSEQGSLRVPMIYFFVGGFLLYLPSAVQVGLTTFWEDPTPYAYVSDSQDPWVQLIQAVFVIIQLIGTIAFIRGLVILSHVGGHGGQQGQFGKALAHIIGGILLINIYQFIQAVANTLGIGSI